MNANQAAQLTHEARVQRTVDKNLDEVKRFAAAGNKGSYYTSVYRDPTVDAEAAKKLRDKGYHVDGGHVTW